MQKEKVTKKVLSDTEYLNELTKRIRGYIKPGIKPLLNVDEYYQANRKIRP